ncbi:putative transcriptional regulator [Pseudomonas aeruginosa]|nr:putative transcriptional regulator [Pseudomonas aeruginosa]
MSVITHPHARELTKSVRATVLVFNDPRSRELLERIERLAPSEANALVIGETGTGKELVARHIHALSGRNGGPFVAVNCGAFAESLVESELFGHEKGAFTGALQSKAGWFEAANGGTLFLDEIGDLPPSIQVKLLRVLQEREVVRLGSRRPIPIDVRLVAATNVDLADAVVAGHFREDLFYRLHVATIQLPPLRERRGDILPLAEYFIVEHCRRLGYTSASLSPEAERKLLGHSWAGNIRELENAIHHALLVCRNRSDPAGRPAPHRHACAPGAERLAPRSRKRRRLGVGGGAAGAVRGKPRGSLRAHRGNRVPCRLSLLPRQPVADRTPAGDQPQHRARPPGEDRRAGNLATAQRGLAGGQVSVALYSLSQFLHKTGKNPDGGCSTTAR